MPLNATLGQFDWSAVLGDGSERLMGRNEVESESKGVSSSFSYSACNCTYDTYGLNLNPYDPFTAVQHDSTLLRNVFRGFQARVPRGNVVAGFYIEIRTTRG